MNLRRDGVQFRGSAGGGGGAGAGGYGARGARNVAVGGQLRTATARVLQPGDEGYDEEADLAAAIFESSLGATAGAGQGGGVGRSGDLAAAAGERSDLRGASCGAGTVGECLCFWWETGEGDGVMCEVGRTTSSIFLVKGLVSGESF